MSPPIQGGPELARQWISAETESKEEDFRGLLKMHVDICKSIIRGNRWAAPSYLYVDLYAGPGDLEFQGHEFPGSPVIAREILTRAGMKHEAVHFEQDIDVAGQLMERLWLPQSLTDTWSDEAELAEVHAESCQIGFPRWLGRRGRQPNRFGIVYADPIDDEIPHELLNRAADIIPRVDLLSYVAANQYKRRRGGDLSRQGYTNRPLLSDHVNAVDKKFALIRKPRGANQYTFILWSNWGNLPDWRRRGFHRLDSEIGAQIMDELDLTQKQYKEKVNTPLPFEREPYRSYAEYLRHPKFLKIRAEVFKRAAGICERCGTRPPTEPHHLRYPPWGTFDVPENMIAVCHQCHCDIHGKAA